MALADRVYGRWPTAWRQVTDDEVDDLRAVIAWAVAGRWSATKLAEEADVFPHDVLNFVKGAQRPRGHSIGLRLLWFVAGLKQDGLSSRPRDISAKIDALSEAARRISVFVPDNDYLFRHLQRLNLVEEQDCKAVCSQIAGHYYSHRLSRNPGKIIRSHYEFLKFTPYNRLPHVVNRLKYGSINDRAAVERTAEGQIMRMGDTFVLFGFVYRGYRQQGRRPQDGIEYDGLQVNLFPVGQMGGAPGSIIDGVFLSYVYNERYEMGRMKLIRKTQDARLKFERSQVGEFTVDEIREMEPALDLSGLELDVSRVVRDKLEDGTKADGIFLTTCLSVILSRDSLFWSQPSKQ